MSKYGDIFCIRNVNLGCVTDNAIITWSCQKLANIWNDNICNKLRTLSPLKRNQWTGWLGVKCTNQMHKEAKKMLMLIASILHKMVQITVYKSSKLPIDFKITEVIKHYWTKGRLIVINTMNFFMHNPNMTFKLEPQKFLKSLKLSSSLHKCRLATIALMFGSFLFWILFIRIFQAIYFLWHKMSKYILET